MVRKKKQGICPRRVSTYCPQTLGNPNPMYDQIEQLSSLLDGSGFVDSVSAEVENFIVDGVFNEDEFLEAMMLKYSDDLDRVCDIFEGGVPPVECNMPPAPSPAELYSRYDEFTPVVDIGSGDCNKLSKFQLKTIATDKYPVENPHITVLEADACEVEFETLVGNRVTSSFNSLTQLSTLEVVENLDGNHVFPDVQVVAKCGGMVEDGKVVYRSYVDNIHERLSDAHEITYGYRAISFFRKSSYSFKPLGYSWTDGFKPMVEDALYVPVDALSTPKYDGTAMLFLADRGRGILKTRNGRAVRGDFDKNITMCLHLEKMPKEGPPEVYILLRVVKYRSYVPFHCLNTLREFCKKIRLKIGGVGIVPPCDEKLGKYSYDGMIYRCDELDYRVKQEHTVDVSDADIIDVLLDEYGVSCSFEEFKTGLWEYKIKRYREDIVLIPLRRRLDKIEATPVEVIAKYLLLC